MSQKDPDLLDEYDFSKGIRGKYTEIDFLLSVIECSR